VCAVRAQYRWCLTGTPIQNSLDDFGSLLSFIRAHPFESKDQFDRIIAQPIKEKKKDSLQILRKVVAATCLRRTKADYASALNLPHKTERVEEIEMDRDNRQLYEFFKRFSYLTAGLDKTSKRKPATNILVLISMLRLICNHGEALLSKSALKAWRDQDQNSLTWEMLETSIKRCVSCDCKIEELDAVSSAVEELKCGHILCDGCVIKTQNSVGELSCPKCEPAGARSPSATSDSSPQGELATCLKARYPPSTKVEALLRNITERQARVGLTAPPKEYDLEIKFVNAY
jgi:SWI/SNF-related matrix-associated actin-dependent regulator of chromatin subfamily A3